MTRQGREVVIEVRDLTTRFGDNLVHQGLNLDVHRGEIIGVVGGSGTGKSVLLRLIAGLMRPAGGRIRVFGVDLLNASDEERRSVEQRWGVMFQDGALFSSLDVQRNVEAPMRELLGIPREMRAALARLKISMVGLPSHANLSRPSELSGGMRKRAGLARALALDPELVFLDEPTAGLDPIGAAAFDQMIRKLTDALGLTVFLVTHDLDSLHAICDRIAVLAEKKVLVTGTMEEMLEVRHPWVEDYFHGPRARAALASA